MMCTHEIKEGSVVTVMTMPTLQCSICRANGLEHALQELVDLVECDPEALRVGTALYTAVAVAKRVLSGESLSSSPAGGSDG